ncbi:MAG: NACHT domain-containing protein [Prochloraceae cyanobacterium]
MVNAGFNIFNSLKLKGGTVSEAAWALIYNGIFSGIFQLLKEFTPELSKKPTQGELNRLGEILITSFKDSQVSIDRSFFKRPKDLKLLNVVQDCYSKWLSEELDVSKEDSEAIAGRLPSYFLESLHQEWGKNYSKYSILTEHLDTPLTGAVERDRRWKRYHARLQQQVDTPLFDTEKFSLRQIYVPLRAYYEIESKTNNNRDYLLDRQNKKSQRKVVKLQHELDNWIKDNNPANAIKIICGGPGIGKSSSVKMFAAKLAEINEISIIFVPLHLINIDRSVNLKDAIDNFIGQDLNDSIFPPNPLIPNNSCNRLLIVFDGLDELAMQGELATRAAEKFVDKVKRDLFGFNQEQLKVQVLLTGRDLVVQALDSQLDEENQILHIIPYYITKNEQKKHEYIDEQNLLKQDDRGTWWQKYGKLSGQNYEGLPELLDRDKLSEITSQPLLNYLVALSYRRGQIKFTEDTNLNSIYADLLDRVYKRDWEKYQHPILGNIKKDDFVRVLEEISIACWHGNGRTATLSQIKERCDSSKRLQQLLESFQEKATEGITRLLTAFYFRKSGIKGTEDTFEFTHKTFREYLVARRFVREMILIHEEFSRHQDDSDRGWDKTECLKRWAILCGGSPIDEYLFDFILDEIKLLSLNPENIIDNLQDTFSKLISFMLKSGMPMEEVKPMKFQEANRQARNAEEALLVALNSCSRLNQKKPKEQQKLVNIKWENNLSFGNWLSRLNGQINPSKISVSLKCLSFVNFNQSILYGANLDGANLREANLRKANLYGANLCEANLYGANL